MSEIKEWQQFTQADIRDVNLSNCTKCGKLIDYAYITTGEAMCESCYLKVVDDKGKELEKRKKEVRLINTTTFVDYVEKEKL